MSEAGRIAEMEAEIAHLRALVCGPPIPRIQQCLGLTRQETRFVRCLMAHEVAGYPQLAEALWFDRPEPPPSRIEAVLAARVRPRLPAGGIVNIHGVGYRLTDAARDALRRIEGVEEPAHG